MNVECCGVFRRSNSYMLEPVEGYQEVILSVLEECPICGNKVAVLSRLNIWDEVDTIRKTNRKADDFVENLMAYKLYRIKNTSATATGSWFLQYSEFGSIKKCYSNISTLKIGLTDGCNLEDLEKLKKDIKKRKST